MTTDTPQSAGISYDGDTSRVLSTDTYYVMLIKHEPWTVVFADDAEVTRVSDRSYAIHSPTVVGSWYVFPESRIINADGRRVDAFRLIAAVHAELAAGGPRRTWPLVDFEATDGD